MSKRKTKLKMEKFYMSYGGNQHPAQVFEKTDVGTYKSIKTGTTPGKDMVEIDPIQKGIKRSFVHKRPFEGSRRDYGDRELLGLSFSNSDKVIIEAIKARRSKKSRSAKKAYKKCRRATKALRRLRFKAIILKQIL